MIIDLSIDYDCTFAKYINGIVKMGTTDKWVTAHTERANNILNDDFNLNAKINKKIKVNNEIARKIMESFRNHKFSIIYGGFEK